jgi:hypothetical protein
MTSFNDLKDGKKLTTDEEREINEILPRLRAAFKRLAKTLGDCPTT